ncbi:MAG: baseplate J/gp47 family protein [Candidatus Fimivivens sp.]
MQTYNEILTEMLARVPDDLDKREGSLIYTALAPMAYMLCEQQFYDDDITDSTMPDTATGALQTRLYTSLGVSRKAATKAARLGLFTPSGAAVAIGSRFGAAGVYYTVSGVTAGGYQLTCEIPGIIGNQYFGEILPLDNLNPDITSATLSTVLVVGEDAEDDDSYRIRFYAEMQSTPFGGNVAQYEQQIKSISGVGDVVVFPTPEGGGTVCCVIVDPEGNPVSGTLLDAVQEMIDPTPQGKGYGLAPIDHVVTITTPTAALMNISATIVLDTGYTLSALESQISAAISDYFLIGVGFRGNIVRVARIETAILSVEGVIDVTGLTLNGVDENLTLPKLYNDYYVPVVGALAFTEGM